MKTEDRKGHGMPDAVILANDHIPDKDNYLKTYLSIKCKPDAVSTTWLTSPGFKAKAASSNSFCISPLPKKPLNKVVE